MKITKAKGKKILSLLLIVAMAIGLLPQMTVTVQAAEPQPVYGVMKSNGWIYKTNSDNSTPTTDIIDFSIVTNLFVSADVTEIGWGTCPMQLPALKSVEIAGKTKINDLAFAKSRNLTTVKMPEVTTIGMRVFEHCTSLTTVEMPKATSIGENAFQSCIALKTVELPKVTKITKYSFFGCTALTTVTMPEATTIGDNAFYNCKALTTVTMPAVTTIGDNAFFNCEALTTPAMPAVTSISNYSFYGCTALTTVTMPEATIIYPSGFQGCTALTTIDAQKLKYTGAMAFYGCTSLTTVAMPKLASICGSAFGDCTSLTTASMPEVTSIDAYAFKGCTSLTAVSMPAATVIGQGAFANCTSLTAVSMPAATIIDQDVFENCTSLTAVSMPAVIDISRNAFANCTSLTTVSMPKLKRMLISDPFTNCIVLRNLTLGPTSPGAQGDPYRVVAFIEPFSDCPPTEERTLTIDGGNTKEAIDSYLEVYPTGNIFGWPLSVEISPPTQKTYTVTYNSNGGTGTVAAQTSNVGTETTVAFNGFTRTGHTFTGWNTAENGSSTAYAVGSTVPSQAVGTTVTLYAQWAENTYSVTGAVNDHANTPASGAGVKLMKGNTQIGTQGVVTDANGKFTITGVPNGIYNLVVNKDDITVTTMIVVNNENNTLSRAITLPIGKTNSIVEVKPNTPDVVVGGLDELFGKTAPENNKGFTADDKNLVETNGGSVTIKLTAQTTDNTAPNANDINTVAKSNTKTIGAFMDFTVSKIATDIRNEKIFSQSAILVELPALIEVRIPLAAELKGKTGYVIYRYHGSNVDEITTNPTEGEYFTVETDTITLHVKKFSTYAIAYQTTTPPVTPPTGGGSGGHSGGSVASSTITTEPSEGGKITISNDKKIATITPNDGYVIADVMVDGKSVGTIEKYTFTDSKTHKINAVFVKETDLPYYMQNGEKIYIGFSAIAEKLYKYIAPAGVKVEFKENPKNFTDNTIAWAKPSIDFVTEREIFLGTTQDKFGPNESMTRGMFAAVIGRLYERSYGSVSGTSTFSDVDANAYYAKYVAWAHEKGIIKGIGANKFAPNEKVTREQMAVMMRNLAAHLEKADVKNGSLAYADSASISSWAIDGAKYCQETKVITGREGGSFAPQESATRAEVAAVIERFIKTILK